MLAGATGEVGASLRRGMEERGHSVVPLTSRAELVGRGGLKSVDEGLALLTNGHLEALVNASGPGDRRDAGREVLPASERLAAAAGAAGVPAVLISTLRVCEGFDGPLADDAPAMPTSPYGRSNLEHESVWLEYPTALVLRMANYFCEPLERDSPQSHLLPWSLLLEGWETGHIGVRSSPQATKAFVSDADVVTALEVVMSGQVNELFGHCLATVPGVSFTMEELTGVSRAVLRDVNLTCSASFGPSDETVILSSRQGWLARQGWRASVASNEMHERMRSWLIEWGPQLHDVDERR